MEIIEIANPPSYCHQPNFHEMMINTEVADRYSPPPRGDLKIWRERRLALDYQIKNMVFLIFRGQKFSECCFVKRKFDKSRKLFRNMNDWNGTFVK